MAKKGEFHNPYSDIEPAKPPRRRRRGPAPAAQEGDSTGGVIPYKNPSALIAYYLGLFSLLPLIGLFLGIPAFILGIKGLKDRKKNPAIKGSVHAWIGIVMGGLMTLVWGAVGVSAIIVLLANQGGR